MVLSLAVNIYIYVYIPKHICTFGFEPRRGIQEIAQPRRGKFETYLVKNENCKLLCSLYMVSILKVIVENFSYHIWLLLAFRGRVDE